MTAVLLLMTMIPAAAARPCMGDAAMQAAVAEALGVSGGIRIRTDVCSVPPGTDVDTAVPEPGARMGRPSRFRLLHAGRPVGYAISTAEGPVRHLRTTRPLAAATVLGDEDVEEVEEELPGHLLQELPGRAEVIGLALSRPLARSQVISEAAVKVPPAVRSGDRVIVRSVVGTVEARTTATAQQSGRIGDVIRLVNAETRRPLRGRIVAKGEVEVRHGS